MASRTAAREDARLQASGGVGDPRPSARARGLGHAHELSEPGLGLARGLVHCDLTPHNVLLA